ncbi:MAG: DUF4221 domain-containing protein [Tannerella sp.]|nr:DUF4221 domain-containing protein [Tannerella sp.]
MEFRLVRGDKTLSFPLDKNTKSSVFSLFPYTDVNGKEYLTFQNPGHEEILFYDMESCLPEFKIRLEREGSNGTGRVGGYHVHNMDSIFLTALGAPIIYIVDSGARVKDKFRYDKATDGTTLGDFPASSSVYKPMVVIGNRLFIFPRPNRHQDVNPLCCAVDLADKSVYGLEVQFPKFPFVRETFKAAGAETEFSSCFNGDGFAYSFYYDEDILVADAAHSTSRRIKAKSRYISRVGYPNDKASTPREICENADYGNMIYDRYREVYYRIAYPRTEVDNDVSLWELIQNGRKTFSIVILNKDFEVIGETRFPDYTYNSMVWFVRADGLYLSASHFMNPDYSDDWFVFHRFDLVGN